MYLLYNRSTSTTDLLITVVIVMFLLYNRSTSTTDLLITVVIVMYPVVQQIHDNYNGYK
jgi:hypothetical protein